MRADRPAERLALQRVLHGLVQAALRQADGERGDADPPVGEHGEALREPAPALAEQVLLRDAALAEHQLVRVARPPPELAVRRAGLEPGRVRRHDDRRDPVRPARRLGRRRDDVERGDRRSRVRDERLRTVDDPRRRSRTVPVVWHLGRVGAGARLRQREPAQRLAASERREPALLLLVRPEPVQQVAGEPDRRRQRDRDRLVDPAELLERQTHRDRRRRRTRRTPRGTAARTTRARPSASPRRAGASPPGRPRPTAARRPRSANSRTTPRNASCSGVRSKFMPIGTPRRPGWSRSALVEDRVDASADLPRAVADQSMHQHRVGVDRASRARS